MIQVYYEKYNKHNDEWVPMVAEFDNCYAAKRFMWNLRYSKAILQYYTCDDPEDNEWLNQNVSLYEINYGC